MCFVDRNAVAVRAPFRPVLPRTAEPKDILNVLKRDSLSVTEDLIRREETAGTVEIING
jgi:hypothetical protein